MCQITFRFDIITTVSKILCDFDSKTMCPGYNFRDYKMKFKPLEQRVLLRSQQFLQTDDNHYLKKS